MSNLALRVMLNQLSGIEKARNTAAFIGRKITAAELKEDRFILTFEDGGRMNLTDEGQSCCEHRYITCDDDLSKLVGGTLSRVEAKEGREEEGEYGDMHEQVFVEVGTNECFVTLVTHNEHNGYYGGFSLTLSDSD